jgi:hypothetical protein
MDLNSYDTHVPLLFMDGMFLESYTQKSILLKLTYAVSNVKKSVRMALSQKF